MPELDVAQDVKLSFLQWLATEDSGRQADYRAYREYYDGDHDTQLTARQREYLQIKIGEEFNTNYCPIVVDALAERLIVTGFEAGKQQGEKLWEWWQINRMDEVQAVQHLASVRDGDAYLLVGWDDEVGHPTFSFELAYDGTEGIKIHYSTEDRRVATFASKRWNMKQGVEAGRLRRLNLYYQDRIEKYASDQRLFEGAWQPYQPDPEVGWPLWWTVTGKEGGEPLGLPVMHFKNKDQGYNYGQSELRSVVPLQNALNKSIIDLLAAADTTAFRIFWMLGADPSGLKVSPGSWIFSTRPPGGEDGAAVGYFPGEDLGPLINLKDSIAIEIARVTRTPISYFQISGQRPAEGTLKQEEAGLVARALNRKTTFGNAWEDGMYLARRLWNVFGSGPALDEEQIISCSWKDAQSRNELQHLEGLKIKAELGVPREQLWHEAGYDDVAIKAMQKMIAAEEAGQANLGEMLLESYERGE